MRAQIRVRLPFEEILRKRPERLGEQHDVRALGIRNGVRDERPDRAVHVDAAFHQRADERQAGRSIVLGDGNDIGNWSLCVPFRNLPGANLV